MNEAPRVIKDLAEMVGGKIDFVSGPLPDGSGFATMSLPLPQDHWLTADHSNVPPMPFRMGTDDPRREQWAAAIRESGRYAARCATMNGKENDFDPDALVQNFITGMLGYWTPNGYSTDVWANPDPRDSLPDVPAK